jgi:hypothetical protein
MRLRIVCAVGLLVGACAVAALPLPQQAVERWYSAGLYPPMQRALTQFSNTVPFAVLDVLLVSLPVAWIALMARDVRRSAGRWTALLRWAMWTAVAAAALYLVFLLTWGLNYRRVPLERKLRFDASAATLAAARAAAHLTVSRLNALYADAHPSDPRANDGVDASLAAAFARATQMLGASGNTVPARPKHTLLDVYFRPAGVAGMTDPLFLETLVESDLLPVERPFVIAHEWSHLAGFADEGEANFSGWLTCTRADAPAQYSGWLFLFGELANSVLRADRANLVSQLAAGPRADLRAVAARVARDVKPQVSAAGWRVYDRYLKANRVEAGAASYAQVVRLVLGTRIGLTADELALPAR